MSERFFCADQDFSARFLPVCAATTLNREPETGTPRTIVAAFDAVGWASRKRRAIGELNVAASRGLALGLGLTLGLALKPGLAQAPLAQPPDVLP